MRLLLFVLLFPTWAWGQEVRDVGTARDSLLVNAVLHFQDFPAPSATVHGLQVQSSDSLAGKDTSDFMINCGCSGHRIEPRLFVNGKEMLARVIPELDGQEIISLTIEKEGEYADRGAIFMETKQRFGRRDFQSLADYLKRHFRGYDKRETAKYIINGSEYPDPEILLPKQDQVVFASVSYGGGGEADEAVTTYTINLKKSK